MKALSNLVPYSSPCDLVSISITLFHGLLRHVIKTYNVVQHPHCLVEWAVAIVIGVGVLLKEVILDELCHFEGNLV